MRRWWSIERRRRSISWWARCGFSWFMTTPWWWWSHQVASTGRRRAPGRSPGFADPATGRLPQTGPRMSGVQPRDGWTEPAASGCVEHRKNDLGVAPVLVPDLCGLEHQGHLRPGVPQPVRRDPSDVVEVLRVVEIALVRPPPVRVRSERHVEHPRGLCVAAYPHLAVRPDLGEPVVERAEPTLVDVPRRPSFAEEASEGLGVAGEDGDAHVLVVARDPGEDLEAPAADDPPRTVE